jgi:hypothetical protein
MILDIISRIEKLVHDFYRLDAAMQGAIVATIAATFAFMTQDLYNTPPEPVCPFSGINGFDLPGYPIEECFGAVLSVACKSVVVLFISLGVLSVLFCKDILYKDTTIFK